jgi:hypothetical protein
MSYLHDLALDQLEGLRAAEFPECDDDASEDEREDRVLKIHQHVVQAAAVGQFVALVSISDALLSISRTLRKIERDLRPHAHAASLNLSITDTPRKGIPIMPAISPVTIDTNFNLALAVTPKDANGNPVVEVPSWSSSNTAVVTVTPAADGLSCLGVTVAPGSATVAVTDGINTDSQDVTVTAGAAASLGLTSSVVPK